MLCYLTQGLSLSFFVSISLYYLILVCIFLTFTYILSAVGLLSVSFIGIYIYCFIISCRSVSVRIWVPLLYYLMWACIRPYMYFNWFNISNGPIVVLIFISTALLPHIDLSVSSYVYKMVYYLTWACICLCVFTYIRPYPYLNCCIISHWPVSVLICISTAVLSHVGLYHSLHVYVLIGIVTTVLSHMSLYPSLSIQVTVKTVIRPSH